MWENKWYLNILHVYCNLSISQQKNLHLWTDYIHFFNYSKIFICVIFSTYKEKISERKDLWIFVIYWSYSSSPKSTCKYINMHVKSTECDEDGNLKTNLTNSLVCLTTIYKCSYTDVNILVIIQTNTYCWTIIKNGHFQFPIKILSLHRPKAIIYPFITIVYRYDNTLQA